MCSHARSALFLGPEAPLEIVERPLPQIEAGEVLVRVRLAAICGSDIHTTTGRRSAPTPCVLGHEIVGEVAAPTDVTSATGQLLEVGDRITWSIMAFCGDCTYCHVHDLPQKCEHLFKYGHVHSEGKGMFSGGYSEYVQLQPGTAIYHVPDHLSDQEAVPVNCALATVVDGLQLLSLNARGCAVVAGSGLLGIYACCWLRENGFEKVIVTDAVAERLRIAERFGATHTFDVSEHTPEQIGNEIRTMTQGEGADLSVEVSGVPQGLINALDWLRMGGTCLTLGLVYPNASLTLDGSHIVKRCLTIRGNHNYHPSALGDALKFLDRIHQKYPFDCLIGTTFPLDQINEALAEARRRKHIRVGIRP